MLARRVLALSTTSQVSLARAFSTSLVREAPRSPAMSDITPDSAEIFNQKQKEFRDGLEAARKRKEQADSQSLAASVSESSPSASVAASHLSETLGLGSLSTAPSTEEARQAEHDTTTKRTGPLSSLIYGTPEGRNMDKEMERSFSQVLARGKYVHSIVFHDVKPDKVDDYVDLVGHWYPRMANDPAQKVHLVGSWRTEVGDCETFGSISLVARAFSTDLSSPHLGIPALHWVPRITAQHSTSP
jgi:hypothetical protein